MKELVIKNLHVSIEGKEILKGVDLTVGENEVHAVMGPNGNGKSTLLAAIMGHPKYIVTEGSIFYDGQDVLAMPVDERSRLGIFLGMQYPQERQKSPDSEQKLLELQLNELGIREMFDAVIGIPDMLAVSKVEQARKWMKEDGAGPEECIYIGDTDHDTETAHALGIDRVYLVSFGHQAAHLLRKVCRNVVDSFDEVIL